MLHHSSLRDFQACLISLPRPAVVHDKEGKEFEQNLKLRKRKIIICYKELCPFEEFNDTYTFPEDPKYSAWWAKKYCTKYGFSEVMLYFPLILFISPLAILLTERGFISKFLLSPYIIYKNRWVQAPCL